MVAGDFTGDPYPILKIKTRKKTWLRRTTYAPCMNHGWTMDGPCMVLKIKTRIK